MQKKDSQPLKQAQKTSSPVKKDKSHLAAECDKVGEVAVHYGFTVVTPPSIESGDVTQAKSFKDFDYYSDAEEKVALMRWYQSGLGESTPQPFMIHYKKPLSGSPIRKKPTEDMYGFEIIGSGRSTSEALIIKTGLAALTDLGYTDMWIEINSIGDRESISKFERELASYFRKQGSELPAKIRQEFRKNPYSLITDTSVDSDVFRRSCPQTIGALSDVSKIHFKEVLEYLEAFEIPYRINPQLLSNKAFAAHTVFEIRCPGKKKDESIVLATGYRYNYLAKKIGAKKDTPTVGLTLTVKKNPEQNKKMLVSQIKKPRFYLVQLGSTAKLKSLNVVEILRTQKIPVYHSLTKDKITGQLTGAEYMNASHVLIIGQKEAIENTIVVRNVATRSQETVALHALADFLRRVDK